MVSFRTSLMAGALLALSAGMAMAQCTTDAGTSSVRPEGVTEPIAPITVTCIDTNAATAGASVTGHYRIVLNAPSGTVFTSRPGVATGNTDSEIQITGGVVAPVPGVINATGSSVTFAPVDVVGVSAGAGSTTNTFQFTLTGLRINASTLAPSTASAVTAGISAQPTAPGGPVALFAGSQFLSILNFVWVSQAGLNFGVIYPGTAPNIAELKLSQCNPQDANLATPTADTPNFPLGFYLNVNEGWSNSFMSKAHENGVNGAAKATQGTRFAFNFSGLPANTQLWVPVDSRGFKGQGTIVATLVLNAKTDGTGGSFANVAASTAGWFPVTANTAVVYEITTDDPTTVEQLTIPVSIAYTGVPTLAPATAGTVTATFAPISGDPGPSQTAPIPRFAGTAKTATGLYAVTPCSTTLLFPYVTTQTGWNVGLSVSNTGTDPFGNTGQAGVCSFSFYGAAGAPAAPVSFGSKGFGDATAIAGGTSAADLASNAIGTGTSFQGYAIAICNFQYAHGYAFIIGNSGTSSLSNGYLALVLQGSNVLRKNVAGNYEATTY